MRSFAQVYQKLCGEEYQNLWAEKMKNIKAVAVTWQFFLRALAVKSSGFPKLLLQRTLSCVNDEAQDQDMYEHLALSGHVQRLWNLGDERQQIDKEG